MKRSMMQVYVKGSGEAVGDAYPNPDGTYYHAELDVYGQTLAVAEGIEGLYDQGGGRVTGNVMQFCLHFDQGEEDKVQTAYDELCEGADIRIPLGPCEYSPLMADLIDRFGVRWRIFV